MKPDPKSSKGEYDRAAENFTHAENNLGGIEDKKEKQKAQASVFYNLGLLNKTLSHFPQAQCYFIKALKINNRIKDQFMEGNILQDLASISFYVNKSTKFIISNLKKSIYHYNRASEINAEKFDLRNYAKSQNKLGNAHLRMAIIKLEAKDCQLAIKAFQETLSYRNTEYFPIANANTQISLGTAYKVLAEIKDKDKNCQLAITAYHKALVILNKKQFPMWYALIQNELGEAYKALARVKDKAKNCHLAITAFQKALDSLNNEQLPMFYTVIQHNLGEAYKTLDKLKTRLKISN